MTVPDRQPHVQDDAETAEDTIVRLDDGGIHVCRNGPRDAPVLLLIHGSAASARSWAAVVPALAGSHRIIRIDLLGHGRSAKPEGTSYEVPEQARRAAAALDRLGIGAAVVVGHSTGGSVATSLAEQRTDLVSALALINTGPSLDALIAPGISIDPPQWPPTEDQVRQFASAAVSRAGTRIPQEMVDDVRAMTHHSFTAGMQAASAYLAQQTLPARLAAVGKPLKVIFGDQDRRWNPSSAHDYRIVPEVEIDLLSGIGHSPILEDPGRTAALLSEFSAAHATPMR